MCISKMNRINFTCAQEPSFKSLKKEKFILALRVATSVRVTGSQEMHILYAQCQTNKLIITYIMTFNRFSRRSRELQLFQARKSTFCKNYFYKRYVRLFVYLFTFHKLVTWLQFFLDTRRAFVERQIVGDVLGDYFIL